MTARLIVLCMALGLASPLWAEEDAPKPQKSVGERLLRIEGKLDALSGVILRLMSERQKALEKERDDQVGKARALSDELAREKARRTALLQEAARAKAERKTLETEVAALKKALAEIRAKYDKLAADVKASSARVETPKATEAPPAVQPRPETLFGEVVQLHRPTDSPEIAVISIGRNRGVQAGHRFVVHRQGRYVATFTVDHVYKNRASGKLSDPAQGERVRVGDSVVVDETSLAPAVKTPDPPGWVGTVAEVDLLTRIVTINRGWSDNLRKGEIFRVFGGLGKEKRNFKGTVQILLLKENTATCMILSDVTAHPIRTGDRVFRQEEAEKGSGSAPLIVGWVIGVSKRHNLVVINVGEEDGVGVGFEFHLFQGKTHAGTLVIDKVYPNQAAGHMNLGAASRKIKVKVGDKVSTRR